MKRPRVYYAHCLAIYGTPQEHRDIETLERYGFEVVNPATREIDERCAEIRRTFDPRPNKATGKPVGYQTASDKVMHEVFKPLVASCDALAFRALPDGRIPSGVALELQWATEEDKPILELPSRISGRIISLAETREYLKEVGQR